MADKSTKAIQDAPLPQMIMNMGTAIADAQFQMDKTAVDIAKYMAAEESNVTIGDKTYSLLELGFSPTFYQLTEVNVEMKMSFTAAHSQEIGISASVGVNVGYFAASVSASYSAKYSFESSASSSISTRFVSIPPPAIFSDRLRESIKK